MTPLGSVGLQGLPRHGWNTDQLHRALSSYPHRTCRYSATLICLTTKHPFQINNCLVGTGLISSLEQDPPPISASPFLLLQFASGSPQCHSLIVYTHHSHGTVEATNRSPLIIIIIIIIMYIYYALINALSAHIIHIKLNTIFKAKFLYYIYTQKTVLPKQSTLGIIHGDTHTHTHTQ